MKPKKSRKLCLRLRVDEDEMEKVRAIMRKNDYPTVSCFLRDVIFKKKVINYKRVNRQNENTVRNKIDELIYKVNKIGVNYNQVVATYNKQAKQFRPDGTPYMNTQAIEDKLSRLMNMTEDMRNEFSLILDVLKQYYQDTSCK